MAAIGMTILPTIPAAAQAPEERAEVVAAAVGHLRAKMTADGSIPRGGAVAIDAEVIQELNFGRMQNRERAALVGRIANVRVSSRSESLRCERGPSSCRLNVDALLSFSEPIIQGSGASVIALRTVSAPNNARQPVTSALVELSLALRGGRWVVVDESPLGVS